MADERVDIRDLVNQLVTLDRAAAAAYEAAADTLDDERSTILREFQRDNERHVQELTRALEQLGGQIEEFAEIEIDLAENADDVLELSGPQEVLMAMHDNEELTNELYDTCLDQEGIDVALRELLERNFGDQQRHMNWLEEELEVFVIATGEGADEGEPLAPEASIH